MIQEKEKETKKPITYDNDKLRREEKLRRDKERRKDKFDKGNKKKQ